MIVPPCPSHSAGIDVIWSDVAVIREFDVANGTCPILSDDFLIKQLPHFGVRPKFPVSPGVMWILDSANAPLLKGFLFWDSFSPTAKARTMNRTDLVATESHRLFLIGFEFFALDSCVFEGRLVAD